VHERATRVREHVTEVSVFSTFSARNVAFGHRFPYGIGRYQITTIAASAILDRTNFARTPEVKIPDVDLPVLWM
jgi:hypothetical protein